MNESAPGVIEAASALAELSASTPARIALGRSGVALPTREVLAFGLAHARARDAVHGALDVPALHAQLHADGWNTLEVRSRALDRAAYLARPDWGRRVHEDCMSVLDEARPAQADAPAFDLLILLGDGLSAAAVQRHAAPLLRALRLRLPSTWRLAPLIIATQARVALADEVGERLHARMALCLIGERPGLSSPDSLGAYLTHEPRVGRSDAERNCISNIHAAGLSTDAAATQIADLLAAISSGGRSGVGVEAPEKACRQRFADLP